MKKVTHTVICSNNSEHKFPVVFELEKEDDTIESHPTVQCPYCGILVEVTIKGKLINDVIIRRLGFDI